ncbi:serine/threonine protein kinase [Amphibacillus marinus]|uniref:Serine/threonine protein kinase n=1 Tax=Amphibacillus marinus TaxID=872970 RepID=A0A1H8HKR4_9BACI|nr:PASTA domain-containing protein [Amphibacillus marinus]SEN56781.1 serine/threonine protein kinase [Amphibacillus marinus]
MSDFLSKFNKDNYDENKEDHGAISKQESNQLDQDDLTKAPDNSIVPAKEDRPTTVSRRSESQEEYEIDPTYRIKKRRRIIYIAAASVIMLIILGIVYYQAVHAEVEDFTNQPVSEVRAWASEHEIELVITNNYSLEYDSNHVIEQSVAKGDKIRKGRELAIVSSLGPDPEEQLLFPDFEELTESEATEWIEINKAENLRLLTVYHDDIEAGAFVELVLRDTELDLSEYRRKDSATVYYSRGEEVFEKNITVPDFSGVPRAEVEEWVTKNEIKMTYKEADSNSIELGHIISQSVAAEEKVAKQDDMEVVVSIGPAFEVPNFNELSMEEATNITEVSVMLRQRYHNSVGYGRLISQSEEAGAKITDQDSGQLTVTYSLGKPYLRDYRGLLEGDLPEAFYNDYQAKGANIKYVVKYVNAPEIKGTVVGMSKFNEFVAMEYTVEVRVSNNANAEPVGPPDFGDNPIGEEPISGDDAKDEA